MGCACSEAKVGAEERLVQDSSVDDVLGGDVWGDEEILNASSADIKRNHEQQGYLDGLTSANESNLQHGFDVAYPLGAKLGILVGRILAKIKCSGDDEVFKQATKELNITQVLSKKYFDDNLDRQKNHDVLEKWAALANISIN